MAETATKEVAVPSPASREVVVSNTPKLEDELTDIENLEAMLESAGLSSGVDLDARPVSRAERGSETGKRGRVAAKIGSLFSKRRSGDVTAAATAPPVPANPDGRVESIFAGSERATRHAIPVKAVGTEASVEVSHEAAEEKLSYKEFKDKQEDLWGANDTIKPEDVPAGELTWEQYLAQRPAGDADSEVHYQGRVRNAETGKFASKAKYEARNEDESATEYYKQYNDARDDERVRLYDEASAENEVFDAKMSETVRSHKEGEVLVTKDARLGAVHELGRELLVLKRKGKTETEQYTRKKLIHDELLRLYGVDGADERALGYLQNEAKALDEAEKGPINGNALFNGESVRVTDMEETAGGTKVYEITLEDGTVRKALAEDLEFKRDYTSNGAEKAQGLSKFEQIKRVFDRERRKIQEYGGMAYFAERMNKARQGLYDRTLDRGVEDSMSEEEKEKRRRRNRIVAIAAVSALTVASVAALTYGGLSANESGVSPADLPGPYASGGGFNPEEYPLLSDAPGTGPENLPILTGEDVTAAQQGGGVQERPEGFGVLLPESERTGPESIFRLPLEVTLADTTTETAPPVETAPVLSNEFYEIPSGQGGEALFGNLGIEPTQWYANQETLLAQFPDDFYRMADGNVGIARPGWLSQGAQDFINTLR